MSGINDGMLQASSNFIFFNQLTDSQSSGCALCRTFFDEENKQFTDYELLEANSAFENIFGIVRNQFVGKKVTEIQSRLSSAKFDFLNVLGHVARYNSNALFYFCTEDDKRWYSASAFCPEKGYFVLMLEEITSAKVEDIKQQKAAHPNQEKTTAGE